MQLHIATTRKFNGNELACYVEDKPANDFGFWMSREQIGQFLGYNHPNNAITYIHKRNRDRLDNFSTSVKMTQVEGNRTVTRDVIVYSFRGLLEICRFSTQPIANQVIDILWDIADEIRRKVCSSSPTNSLRNNFLSSPSSKAVMPSMSNNFGDRLRALRKKSGLTQEQLADSTGFSLMTIRRWEWGERSPRVDEIKALAKALGVSEADLLNDPPPNSGEWVINFKTVTRFDDKEVIDLTGNISPVCGIQAAPDGCGFVIKADWDTLSTKGGLEKLFKQVVRDFYKPIQAAGIAYRKIPESE